MLSYLLRRSLRRVIVFIISVLLLTTFIVASRQPRQLRPASAQLVAAQDALIPSPQPSNCHLEVLTQVSPEVLLLGEALTVTHRLQGRCLMYDPQPVHIAVVVDPASGVAANELKDMRDAMRGMDLDHNPDMRIGVIEMLERAHIRLPLVNDQARLNAVAGQLVKRGRGDTRIEDGLGEALNMLAKARRQFEWPEQIAEIVILFSDGRNAAGCGRAIRASQKLKTQNILLITACLGEDCDEPCLRKVATSPSYFLQIYVASRVIYGAHHYRGRLPAVYRDGLLYELNVRDRPAPKMQFIDQSAAPPLTLHDLSRSELGWSISHLPSYGMNISYQVRPLSPGQQRISPGARFEWKDAMGRPGQIRGDAARVMVLAPRKTRP